MRDTVRSARKNAEPRECQQEGKNTCMHGFDYKRVFHSSEVADRTVLKKVNFMAREMLIGRALKSKRDELERQKWRDREELARKIEELEKKFKAAKKAVARLTEAVRGSRTSQDRKCETAEEEVVMVARRA